jgi:hypothetical protein
MTVIDRHSRATRRLGGNTAHQRPTGEAAGEGMRWAAHGGLDGAPWHGAWSEFHQRAARRGAKEGNRFGTVTSAVSGRLCNGFYPRRREADVRGPRDTGAHLAATRGRKRRRPVSRTELGRGSARCWADAEKMTRDPFPIFKFLLLLISEPDGNNNRKKYLWITKNVKFCMETDLNICHNFCIGHFDQRSTIFK